MEYLQSLYMRFKALTGIRKAICILMFIAIALVTFGLFQDKPGTPAEPEISMTDLVSDSLAGKIRSLTFSGTQIVAEYKDGHETITSGWIPEPVVVDLLKSKVELRAKYSKTTPILGLILNLVGILVPLAIIGFMLGGRKFNIGGNYRVLLPGQIKTKFADVAGQDNAKHDLQEIAAYLKNPKLFKAAGAKVPKGTLLSGGPGIGKTLLARALAGEAGVPFISASGSTFRETFMGQGGRKIRKMFEKGRKLAPAIIFIDEIETLGRSRSAGKDAGGERSEEEATLNALLVELDGFISRDDIILIAATNRPDIIDPALLRPGRFDRHIELDTPDLAGRLGIIDIHLRDKKIAPSVEIKTLAKKLAGMTGAGIANLLNEAAIRAARRSDTVIQPKDLEGAYYDTILGKTKAQSPLTTLERKIIAVHEAGHAVVSMIAPGAKKPDHATILPRGRTLGVVVSRPDEEDRKLAIACELKGSLTVLLAGRAAEMIEFGRDRVSSGASGDFKEATNLALRMVSEWSMTEEAPGLFPIGNLSQQYLQDNEDQARKIIADAWNSAINILKTHATKHRELVSMLLENETVTGLEIESLFRQPVPATAD